MANPWEAWLQSNKDSTPAKATNTNSLAGIYSLSTPKATPGISATPAIVGKKATPAKATPAKATTPTTATGSKLQQAVTPATQLTPGLSDQLSINNTNAQSNVADAMRLYQNEAAKQQLQNSLATINRSAMQQYEGVANDYAARGMVRSGGYVRANDQALATTNQQKVDAESAVRDFIAQNQLQGVTQTGMKQANLQDILIKLLTQFNTNNINQLGL